MLATNKIQFWNTGPSTDVLGKGLRYLTERRGELKCGLPAGRQRDPPGVSAAEMLRL